MAESPSFKQSEEQPIQAQRLRKEIDDLTDLAWKLRIGQKERAYSLCQQAAKLSSSGPFTAQAYNQGLAASLAVMAGINSDWGKPDLTISQCIEALSLLDGLPPSKSLVDIWIQMEWIHIYLGSYPTALDYGIKALNLARELKDWHREAWALDAIASTYGITADSENSIILHEQAFKLFAEVGDVEGQARTLNNQACTLLESGQPDRALDASLKSLEIARQKAMHVETMIFCNTAGDILLAKGDYKQAEKYIRNGLINAEEYANTVWKVYGFISLGKLYLAEACLQDAKANLIKGLVAAEAVEMRKDMAECHRLLSEVDERLNNLAGALDHYKQYHRLIEATSGEETAKRMAILKVTHQSENAMRDAEIYRLHNIELQRDIEERKQMESLLHNMAIHDPLTNLYNRRQFYMLARLEIERARRGGSTLSVLMLDLDHFKQVNDRYGHLAGDQVLVTVAKTIQANLRERDIVGRYGGEEFVILLPEIAAKPAYEVSERIRRSISDLRIETTAGVISVTISIGVTDLTNDLPEADNTLDILLNRADQALYSAKQKGRNAAHLLAGSA